MAGERAIRIEAGGGVRLYAILEATPTAEAVWEVLPIEGRARLRSGEIHFDAALRRAPEPEARRQARSGDVGFWPEGKAIALFFGPPPDAPAPADASPVHVFARITGDATRLARVREGDRVRLTALAD